ncbi:MAG: hypothetical protein K1000chlam2_00981 [Chlamydiae bacterium]|nr:hypothetical protein [Chlamydiota bacterium]
MNQPVRDHQIEEMLLKANQMREVGTDLIDEYFARESSLDLITKRAHQLLQQHRDPHIQETILKNLSECIVVKTQKDRRSFGGLTRKALSKIGIPMAKSNEVIRAEKLISSSRFQ